MGLAVYAESSSSLPFGIHLWPYLVQLKSDDVVLADTLLGPIWVGTCKRSACHEATRCRV